MRVSSATVTSSPVLHHGGDRLRASRRPRSRRRSGVALRGERWQGRRLRHARSVHGAIPPSRHSPSCEERRPRTQGGCAGGVAAAVREGVDRPPCPARRRRAGQRSARLPHPCGEGVRARGRRGACAPQCRAATPMKRMRTHDAWSPCMAIRISGAGSTGNNDDRTAESLGRSGRVIPPFWNIVANAAIRTGPYIRGTCAGDERQSRPGLPPADSPK
jgi:hypothetical protein